MVKERVKPVLAVAVAGDAQQLRKVANKYLKEIEDDVKALSKDKTMIKDILGRYGGSEDLLDSKGRSAKVREAAIGLAGTGLDAFSPKEVIDYLKASQGIDLDVGKPASVAGTILAQLAEKGEFKRHEDGRFTYLESHSAEANGTGAD